MAELRTLVNDFLASQKGNLTAGQFCKSYGNMNQGNFSNWRNHPESFAEDEIPPAIKAGLEKWLAERGEEHEGDLFHTPKTSPEKPLKEEVVAAPKATVVANLFPDKPTTPAKQDQLLAVLASHGLRGQPALAACCLPTNWAASISLRSTQSEEVLWPCWTAREGIPATSSPRSAELTSTRADFLSS